MRSFRENLVFRSAASDRTTPATFNGNFAYIFLGFGLFLTFVVLFNTVNASFHERRTEFAIMQM